MRTAIALLALVATPALAQLGSLTPPPGAVTETMKPLDVVEARTPVGPDTTPGTTVFTYLIAEPGSYYLTEDLVGDLAMGGIRIEAPDVTLDLNGFSIRTEFASIDGINATLEATNLTVKNGTVSGWGADGVTSSAADTTLEDLRLTNNAEGGARAFGRDATVRRCIARGNGGDEPVSGGGFLLEGGGLIVSSRSAQDAVGFADQGDASRVVSCTVEGSLSDAFVLADDADATFENCVSTRAGQAGFAVRASESEGNHSVFRDCTAQESVGNGFEVFARATASFSNCVSRENGDNGFRTLDADVTFAWCQALENALFGFRLQNTALEVSARLSDCTARGNFAAAIVAQIPCTIERCSTVGGIDGINADVAGAVVVDSTVKNSQGNGIVVGDRGIVQGCVVDGATAFGIDAGARARVSGCTVSNAAVALINLGTSGEVTDSVFTGSSPSVLNNSLGCRFLRCTFRDLDTSVNFSARAVVESCEFRDINDFNSVSLSNNAIMRNSRIDCIGSRAIQVSGDNCVIDSNHISNSSAEAIFIPANANASVLRNTFAGNGGAFTNNPGNNIAELKDIMNADNLDNILLY